MSNKPQIVVTQTRNQVRVTNLTSGQQVTCPPTADAVRDAMREVGAPVTPKR